jgi:hypothetical protein
MPSEASLANLKAPWQKGQSANERGRTRGYARILHASRKASPEAIEKAIECMRDETAPWNNRLKAVEIILDRAWGAPDQHMQLDGADGSPIVIVTGVRRDLEQEPGPPTITINTGVERNDTDTGEPEK